MWKFLVLGLLVNTIRANTDCSYKGDYTGYKCDETIAMTKPPYEGCEGYSCKYTYTEVPQETTETTETCQYNTTTETPTNSAETVTTTDEKTPLTTETPITTTSITITTTEFPTTTTEPITVTEANPTTNESPTPTTQKRTTTESPTNTAKEITTTETPTTTTKEITTTESPTTTAKEITTTESPTTTAKEITTTESPSTTTLLPTTITKEITTTESLTTTTELPTITTKQTTTTTEISSTATESTTTTTEITTTTTEVPPECSEAKDIVLKSMLSFSAKLLHIIAKANVGKTVVGSAVSLLFLLGPLKLKAVGKLHTELTTLFYNATDYQTKCGLMKINKIVEYLPHDVIFLLGNNIFADNKYIFSDSTKQDLVRVVGSQTYRENITILGEAENVDIANQEETAETVNEKIKNQTHAEVTDVITPSNLIDIKTQMFLASGLQYSSQFEYKPRGVEIRDFYVSPCKKVKLPYYHFCEEFQCAESTHLESQIYEIPLTGEQRLFLIKPHKKFRHMSVIKKLEDPNIIPSLRAELKPCVRHAYLPTINASMTNDVIDVLKKSNAIPSLFESDTPQFKGLFEKDQKIDITAGIQKVNFISKFKGKLEPSNICEQTNVTGTVDLNHPFIWVLFVKDICSFIGLYANNNFALYHT